MGFMNVLKFSATRFDLLSWPLFALGYPLCASIWVIETNSITDIRKLVMYWVLFSFISLFDHAFAKLLEWIPFWPYIKLMVICCLVMPHFDGSYYVYQHLLRPYLSIDPQFVMNRLFNESKKLFHSRESFLVAADKYIKDNGAEGLEKLLASKLRSTKRNVELKEIKAPPALEKKVEQWKGEEPNVAQKGIQVVEVTEIKNGDGAKQVKRTEINVGEPKCNTTCAEEIKERTATLLNSHLQGTRDKATSEQLKAENQATKTNGSPSASTAEKSDRSTKEEQPKCTSNNLKAKNNGISAASTVKKPDEQYKCASSNGLDQNNNKKQRKELVPETNKQGHRNNRKQTGGGVKKLRLRCSICNVKCYTELTMASHLNGRRHLEKMRNI